MGVLARVSSVITPARLRAGQPGPLEDFWYVPSPWLTNLSAAGVLVTPELGLTLSAMYSGVTMIGMDLATLPAQMFRLRDDGGKDRVRPFFGGGIDTSGGIRSLAYMLRWQPNTTQTATEFWLGMIAQLLLREHAYAEIVSGPTGFVEQLLPRHPDRVRRERLPSGRLRYTLTEAMGQPRYLTQDEMFSIQGLSLDGGLTGISRVSYGAQSIGSALATQKAQGKFFKSGMTAAKVATYQGQMDPEDEARLHASISRFAAGVENSFGLALIPDNVTITNLGVDPEKAQMILAQEWGVREIARLLRLPGHKLGIKDSVSYNSQVQAALDYVINCLRTWAVLIEQAIQRDLILAKDTYLVEFLLAALLRGDFESQANYLEKFIRNRIMRPSEARLILNMNPDADLDRLSEGDFRPGTSNTQRQDDEDRSRNRAGFDRAEYKALLAVHDNAVRCLRRERAAVEKLAKRFASDVDGWKTGLRDFFADHAQFVAQTMRLHPDIARGYAAQHGSEFEAKGVVLIDGEAGAVWERFEADELAWLALDHGENTIEAWFTRRLVDTRTPVPSQVHVTTPVTIDKGAVQVDARTTVEGAQIDVQPSAVTIADGAISVPVHVEPAAVTFAKGAISVPVKVEVPQAAPPVVNVAAPAPVSGPQEVKIVGMPIVDSRVIEVPDVVTTVEERDGRGRISRTRQEQDS